MFRQAALFAPAFGVAGSVVGLIDMLAGITNPDVILKTIPIALTAPLYGIVLANSVCFPIAESIHAKTQKELLIQRLNRRRRGGHPQRAEPAAPRDQARIVPDPLGAHTREPVAQRHPHPPAQICGPPGVVGRSALEGQNGLGLRAKS